MEVASLLRPRADRVDTVPRSQPAAHSGTGSLGGSRSQLFHTQARRRPHPTFTPARRVGTVLSRLMARVTEAQRVRTCSESTATHEGAGSHPGAVDSHPAPALCDTVNTVTMETASTRPSGSF